MPIGIQVYDENGNTIMDMTGRVSLLVGSFTIAKSLSVGATGNYTNDAFKELDVFFIVQNNFSNIRNLYLHASSNYFNRHTDPFPLFPYLGIGLSVNKSTGTVSWEIKAKELYPPENNNPVEILFGVY